MIEYGMETCTIPNKKLRSQSSAGRLMLRVLEHYQERDTTVNSACYREMPTDRLNPVFQSKC
jgi:hypothetical protein